MLDTNIYKMAEKDLNDPDKDYGLPKVEIKPLSHSSLSLPIQVNPQEVKPTETEKEKLESIEKAPMVEIPKQLAPEIIVPKEPETKNVLPVGESPKEGALQKSSQAKDEPVRVTPSEKKKTPVKEETKNRSYAWVWVVVILGIGAGAWAIFKSNQVQPEVEQEPVAEKVEATPPVTPTPPVEEEIEVPIQKTGLTEIREREANPRFFVVVGSFNNEAMAKDFSENLHQKKMNTYLVYPYGEVKNFRLAVAHFPSFELALNELNRVKADFKKEELWVLKY